MRFCYAESMTDPAFYGPLAQAAEEAGFHGFMVPDSVCYPEHATSSYPYNSDGTRAFLDDAPFIEPMVLIAQLSAMTTDIEFVTSVIKLPLRHPVHMAKQATSLAVISGNRLVLGVGTSPWPEDYDVCEIPWARRGPRMDEQIDIIRRLAAGGYVEHRGEFYAFPSIKLCPVPTQPIPIIIGGHGDAALRRAARIGDGWSAAGGTLEFLTHATGRLAELRKENGRDHLPFAVYAGTADAFTRDGLKRLEELGVTDVFVGFRDPYVPGDTQTLADKVGAVRWYGEEMIAAAG